MRYDFLSDEWFSRVDELVAAAGDLQLPAALKEIEVNVTVTGDPGDTRLAMRNGLFTRGHNPGAPTTLTLTRELARKIFIDADAAAGMQAFLAGEIKVEGDLAKLVAMQTVQPSAEQRRLTRQIADLTA